MTQWVPVLTFLLLLFGFGNGMGGEVPRPSDAMSAEGLAAVWYDIEYSRFARDYKNYNTFILIDRDGARRERKALRARIILDSGEIDYKDYAVFLSPASIRGVAMLTWTYRKPDKEREQWLYLPSMRKARRSSPSEDDENALGTVLTYEEISTWKPQHETYVLTGVRNFAGYTSDFDGKRYYEQEPCFVLEAFPVRKNAVRSKRTFWLGKRDGCCLFQEVFDKNGKMYKSIFRRFEEFGDRKYPATVLVEAKDLRTGDSTIIRCDKIIFDSGMDETEFTIEKLQRTKW